MTTLPPFKKERYEDWIRNEMTTARFVRALWNAAGPRTRSDPAFVSLLVQCAWTNVGEGDRGWESTRIWRNALIGKYLNVEYGSDGLLAENLASAFPRLKRPIDLIREHTGITHYYRPLRPPTLRFVQRHAGAIASAMRLVASRRLPTHQKVRRVVDLLTGLGSISGPNGAVSPLNGITPVLACLDPRQRFPIVNQKTTPLLKVIRKRNDSDGAIALTHLIGQNNIKNALELDVYASTTKFPTPPRQAPKDGSAEHEFRNLGIKSEEASIAHIAANKKRIRKLHNRLTHRLYDYLLWRHMTAQEAHFDALIPNWKKGRDLLIEAKTAFAGPSGRSQIRQAIGQLFDYRHTHFRNHQPVDLAVLLPSKPSEDVRSLLTSLDIEVLWFAGKQLRGTVAL